MATYSEKLKDPRWQKKRLQVLERDEWACQICGDNESTLHVHHRYYQKGKDPWDYPLKAFATLCDECHEIERTQRKDSEEALLQAMREKFFSSDVFCFAIGIHHMELLHTSEVVASAFSRAMEDWGIQKLVLDAYWAFLKDNRQKHETSEVKLC